MSLQHGQTVLDGVIEDVLDLQLVLVIGVAIAQMSELFRLIETPLEILGRNKVLGNLDAVMNVPHLEKQTDLIVKISNFCINATNWTKQ